MVSVKKCSGLLEGYSRRCRGHEGPCSGRELRRRVGAGDACSVDRQPPLRPRLVLRRRRRERYAEERTGGLLRKSDFLPLPCSHPSCFGLTYMLKTDAGFIPFPRFIELDRYLEVISNRGTIRPDEGFETTIRATIDELWSSSGQIPNSAKILGTLKRAIHLMYPEDRAVELEERMHIGEGLVKTIFIHAFMDEHTFEIDRIKKCCTHYALPDGRLMPGCAYNMFYRHKDPRFTGPKGRTEVWGKTVGPAASRTRIPLPVVPSST